MNIEIFNKEYLVRRFDEERIVKGYFTTSHADFKVSLNVHPPSDETINALPEGERKISRLEGHGSDVLRAADQDRGIKGDLLRYRGKWYECISALPFDHTLLSHWNYKFVVVPDDVAGTIDTAIVEEGEENESD